VLQIKQDATLKRADAAPKKPLYLDINEAVKSFAFDGTVELYAVKDEAKNDQIKVYGKGKFGNTSKLKVTWFDNAPAILPKDESWRLIKSTYPDATNPQIDQKPATFVKPPLRKVDDVEVEGVELVLVPYHADGQVYANSFLDMESTK
jgi:hypothetical protein